MSNKNQLKFESIGIDLFAGIGPKTKAIVQYPADIDISEQLKNIDPDNGLMIVFPDGYNYIELSGNQGVGKTSFIECLKEMTGGQASTNTEHLQTTPEGATLSDKRYKDRFWGVDGCLYNLRVTKSTITLERIEVDDEGKPIKNVKGKENASIMKTPKTYLQQVIGPAGISPMVLKAMNGAEQVKWVRSLFNPDVEQQALEIDIKKKYDQAYKDRTKTNNDYKSAETLLEANQYYKEMEKWQTYFDTTKYEDLEKEVGAVIKGKADYDKAVELLPTLKNNLVVFDEDITDLERQIKELQEKLEAKKTQREDLNTRITNGEKYIADNKGIVTKFEELADKRKEASEFKMHEENFANMKTAKVGLDRLSDEKIRLNNLVDEYEKVKKDFIKAYTPDIPEFEVCVKDEGEQREGLFYKKLPLSMLAESELWELATMIWDKMGVKIIYVENVSSLGSGAVAKFNEFLSRGGCYIFGTQMNRNEDSLKITFNKSIPE